MKTVILTSTHPVGCTFINWSIYFLGGYDRYYHQRSHSWLDLSTDPISTAGHVFNCHNHQKNHPSGFNQTVNCLQSLPHCLKDDLIIIYPYPLHFALALEDLNTTVKSVSDPDTWQKILDYVYCDYERTLNYCIDQGFPMVYVEADPKPIGYYWDQRALEEKIFSLEQAKNKQERVDEFREVFFGDQINQWKDLGLIHVWDTRERMALDLRPFSTITFKKFGFAQEYLHLNSQNLWNLPENTMLDILKFLNISVDKKRLGRWRKIAQRWQKKQLEMLKFYNELDHIVTAIVNNWYHKLPSLTLDQEAIIQNCLIYQHNLNIKTWQLEKFPDNTKELHKLLEPNIHKLVAQRSIG